MTRRKKNLLLRFKGGYDPLKPYSRSDENENEYEGHVGKRHIICADSVEWMKKHKNKMPNVNIITGLPDMSELHMWHEEYIPWFQVTVELVFNCCNRANDYVIFVQTDRIYKNKWIDKSFLIHKIADKLNFRLMWHKIIKYDSRNVSNRPQFMHYVCYSKEGSPGTKTPDFVKSGKKSYDNGHGCELVTNAVQFIKQYSTTNIIFDPFMGQGILAAIANKYGMDAIGIDIDPEQCEIAKKQTMTC